MLETFVDPLRFHGTIYRVANWADTGISLYSQWLQYWRYLSQTGFCSGRRIWCSTALNEYLDFPHVVQVFLIEREALYKKTGKITHEVVLGITNGTPEQASPERILKVNRGHWTIENRCHYVIDWNFDEDRSRIRTGHGPENITRPRRFACSVIQFVSKGKSSISQKMQQLNRNTRLVFGYLRMTSNSTRTRSL